MVSQGKKSVTLSFAHNTEGPVYITGSFNGWSTHATPMQKVGQGKWQARLQLPPGEHQFRYYANGQWFTDYAAGGVVPNGFGEFNSILAVPSTASAPSAPAKSRPRTFA